MAKKPTSFRLPEGRDKYLDFLVNLIPKRTGTPVTKTWVVLQLMDFGQGPFHEKFGITENDLENAGIHL